MKKNKSNIIPILGVVAFALYFLMYIVTQIYNVSTGNYYCQIFFHTTIINLLKIIILYGLITAYLCINISNNKKKPIRVLSIILLVVSLLLIISDITYTLSYITTAIEYIDYNYNFILLGMQLQSVFHTLTYIAISISLLGLALQKKFPYKVLMIVSIVLVSISSLFGFGTEISRIFIAANIRAFVDQFFVIVTEIFFLCFNIFYILTIYKNGKEIKETK